MQRIQIKDKTFKTLIPYEQISEAIDKVADRLNADFGSSTTPPILLCVLNGSIMFMGELMKRVDFDCQTVSIKLTSYEGTSSTGKVRQALGLTSDITGRDVIIIEDIVDTGLTMQHLVDSLSARSPRSIAICSLLVKPANLKIDLDIRYKCFEIPNDFILGYGLDYDGFGRNTRDIYTVVETV